MLSRRTSLKLAAATAALAAPAVHAQQPATVRWWYHFDNPTHSPAELVAAFERENPGIKIQAESIPWGGGGDYANRLYTAVVGRNAPDCAMVKLQNLSRLVEMQALEPLEAHIANWAARADIPDNLYRVNRSADGKQYYLPVQYVVLYLYYRADWFRAANLQPPQNFEQFLNAAKTLTREADQRWGFGMRGGAGGHDHWGTFVLGGGASFDRGGMVSEGAFQANRWFVNLMREHKVFPPSAPNDGFRQIIDNFKAGRTAMTIHHIGSANEMVQALGDNVSAVPVPKAADGRGWTAFGDESNAVFAQSRNKEAAFKWIAFLSTGANNVAFNRFTGQLTVTRSGAQRWDLHPQRFVQATMDSLPIAAVLPDRPQTADFVRTVWPQNMQRALLGQISADDMMRAIERHYHG
jgi:multiple sugar transport system substrate-binding protein